MWADAQRDGRPAEYRWRPLRKFLNSIPFTTPQVWLTPTTRVPCTNPSNIGERKTWTRKVSFAPGKIPIGARAPESLGEENKKKKKKKTEETTGQKYNGLPYSIGRP